MQKRKQQIRKASLARRDALPVEQRSVLSTAIAALDLPFLGTAPGVVSGFLPIRSEIDPRPLMQRLAAAGHSLALPRIIDDLLEFAAYAFGDPLVIGGFGTAVPGPDAPIVDPDLMLVPLSAYDRRGGRLGYGKGYYDGAIARLHAAGRRPITVGLAFSVQEVDKVPMEPHDRRLDWILTELGAMRTDTA
ncbi:MAG: 5-formyltetrahydrofolate cyclo-ligase [Hyphomicrobiales bacterium]|nr:5-formyltetrahydrofolate cyclo-ligase [Hyphomicrobiales bacterium]